MLLGPSARRWWASGGFVLLLATTACQNLAVTDLPADHAMAASATPASPQVTHLYDLAISAIDVEKANPRSFSDAVTLLAVVENRGIETSGQIQIEGRLYDGTGKDLLLKKSESVESLAAGESKVVRFKATEPLPLREGYIVRVEAVPLTGETNLTNNSRVLRAQVQFMAARER